MENLLKIRLDERISIIKRNQQFKNLSFNKQIFSIPIIGKRKIAFKVPYALNAYSLTQVHNILVKHPVLDVKKHQKIIAALAAIILLQHSGLIFKKLFKRSLTTLLKNNVDANKSLALVELLYKRTLNSF